MKKQVITYTTAIGTSEYRGNCETLRGRVLHGDKGIEFTAEYAGRENSHFIPYTSLLFYSVCDKDEEDGDET